MAQPVVASSSVPLVPLALADYRAAFLREVAQGHRRHIVLPQALVTTLILPIVWIAIPHHDRSWLWRSRWFVFALVFLANCEQAARASSVNVAWAVISGLMSTYGTMLCFQYMILTNPQRDAARIIRVACGKDAACAECDAPPPPHAFVKPEHATGREIAATESHIRLRGGENGTASRNVSRPENGRHVRYVWQRFPSKAPLLDRLGWAADLVLSFRGSGWNTSISVIPRSYTPNPVQDGQLVNVTSVPSVTKHGFEYLHPPAAFLWHRLKVFMGAYLMLDFLGTFMIKDPYFVFGREKSVEYALPWYLAGLSPWRLEAYRQLFSITGAFVAVAAASSLVDILHYCANLHCNPSRNVPWIYASAFGSLGEVFDRGLEGFWGSWWHQTFRQQFLGPSAFLVKHGWIQKGTAVGNLVALLSTFAVSGLLHASGSLSSMPLTKLWRQPAFFLLQAVGIIVQQQLASLAHKALPAVSITTRRAGNALFTFLWLYGTANFFNDDMAAMGIYLLEPVPLSVFRAAGLGFPGDAIWRWDGYYLFRWHSGRRWWQSGLTI
ncbi:hypothetical protein CRV24_002305 [Beauveria bassiana]|nr:hypothetical protein CRV24_002305 [Beauveria bassiana]KAH8717663.1 hypothetical protein HC256_002345 [Beauveria bassiana]